MSAREEIAGLLWWSVPSGDDAEAKAAAGRMLDAYRAEVLREAAAAQRTRHAAQGIPCAGDGCPAVEVISLLDRMAAEGGEGGE